MTQVPLIDLKAQYSTKTFNLDSSEVSSKITSRTKAVMPVHLFGQCAEMDPTIEIVRDTVIHVIEDAAQAIGARDREGEPAAQGTWAASLFSPSKNLGAFGDGEMVSTNDWDGHYGSRT